MKYVTKVARGATRDSETRHPRPYVDILDIQTFSELAQLRGRGGRATRFCATQARLQEISSRTF
jgi:hypothetical protein